MLKYLALLPMIVLFACGGGEPKKKVSPFACEDLKMLEPCQTSADCAPEWGSTCFGNMCIKGGVGDACPPESEFDCGNGGICCTRTVNGMKVYGCECADSCS